MMKGKFGKTLKSLKKNILTMIAEKSVKYAQS